MRETDEETVDFEVNEGDAIGYIRIFWVTSESESEAREMVLTEIGSDNIFVNIDEIKEERLRPFLKQAKISKRQLFDSKIWHKSGRIFYRAD